MGLPGSEFNQHELRSLNKKSEEASTDCVAKDKQLWLTDDSCWPLREVL